MRGRIRVEKRWVSGNWWFTVLSEQTVERFSQKVLAGLVLFQSKDAELP